MLSSIPSGIFCCHPEPHRAHPSNPCLNSSPQFPLIPLNLGTNFYIMTPVIVFPIGIGIVAVAIGLLAWRKAH